MPWVFQNRLPTPYHYLPKIPTTSWRPSSAENLRMPSAVFSVAIAFSFSSKRKCLLIQGDVLFVGHSRLLRSQLHVNRFDAIREFFEQVWADREQVASGRRGAAGALIVTIFLLSSNDPIIATIHDAKLDPWTQPLRVPASGGEFVLTCKPDPRPQWNPALYNFTPRGSV